MSDRPTPQGIIDEIDGEEWDTDASRYIPALRAAGYVIVHPDDYPNPWTVDPAGSMINVVFAAVDQFRDSVFGDDDG